MKDRYLIFLWVICIVALCCFVGHYQNIMLDVGREIYYPQRILQGKVLYKDLFVIYGPFSYLFNAILYKIIGAKLSTLYISGSLCSLGIVSGIYLIARKFLTRFLGFCIGLFVIVIGVANTSLFNFHFPYSWAMVYGMLSFIWSVYFLVKYSTDKKPEFLITSSLLAGICALNKYDFIVYGAIFFCYLIYLCKKDLKTALISIAVLAMPAIVAFGTLFLQGLSLNDIVTTMKNINSMAHSQTLKYFYTHVGVYFHPQLPGVLIRTILGSAIAVAALCFGVYKNNRLIIGFGIFLTILNVLFASYMFMVSLPIVFLICAIVFFKKYKNNAPLLVLVISGCLVCLKSFWGLLLLSYGDFYAGIVLTAFLGMIFTIFDSKYQKITGIYILIISLGLGFSNYNFKKGLSAEISTEKGTIYTYGYFADADNELIDFIKTNTNKNDKVVIFPEGMIINFLTERKSDDYYNSMLPLYTESLDEDKIVKHFENNKPDYIVFSNESMKSYGLNSICNDYAFELCRFVSENYKPEKTIDNNYRYLIFKKL